MAIQQTFDFLDTPSGESRSDGECQSLSLRESRALKPGEGGNRRQETGDRSQEEYKNTAFPDSCRLSPESFFPPPRPLPRPTLPEGGCYKSLRDNVAGKEPDRTSVLRELRVKVGCVSTAANDEVVETLSTGSDAIDGLLPRAGLRLDTITEWVAEADGCGAAALSMIAAATHLRSPHGGGPLVVVAGQNNFYPPAAVAFGVPAERIVLVRPTRHADVVWAIDQALRCESVAAVWAHLGANLDDRDARRFQLAAETGRTPGLFVRPAATRGRPSFADVRLHVQTRASTETLGRAMNVTLDRCRGGTIGHSVWVQIGDRMAGGVARIHQVTPQQLGISEHETAAVRLASELAHPKTANRRASRRHA